MQFSSESGDLPQISVGGVSSHCSFDDTERDEVCSKMVSNSSFPHKSSSLSHEQLAAPSSVLPLLVSFLTTHWVLLISISLIAFLLWRSLNFLTDKGFRFFRKFVTISVQFTGGISNSGSNADAGYHSLILWLAKHTKGSHSQKIAPKTVTSKRNEDGEDSDSDDENYRPSPDYEYVYRHTPTVGYGVNDAFYKGRWIRLSRSVISPTTKVCSTSQEILIITTFFWNKSLLSEIMELSKPKPKKKDNSKLVIYKAMVEELYWARMGGPKKKRPLKTLILDEQTVTRVVSDVHKFLDMESWYLERGIPYRRGYLLYGPPGCGKSSIVKAIAGELNYDICIFSLSQKLTDNALTELFNSAPEKSIILLEDIDAAFKSRDTDGATARETNLAFEGCSQSALTFMGLLNALDGVASADDGQLVFMTTNYPERLDPALVRPGRVDLKICVDYPSDAQIEGMFKKFYPEVDPESEMVGQFLKAIRGLDLGGQKVSMAMLQGLMVVYREDPKDAIDKCEEHFKEQFANCRLARDKCGLLYS
ncbi:mitochondrial chaperone BCS1 [Folsomia candida]|uniref:Mitochondrial chaperone BCS1 n=1 Tax=Folsomia candida TaxID=158441 RepID=A0A226D0C6_FOLCA|nr:mitochondrial chaperone BCS1 [Folsomia candida]OXA38111.1 Mitochondrial chaperone BCS1 [Folsomia candida]